ncbi:ABA4-like family protein [Schleiferiaceae bacterium]|nr:ABA4-like family protein [Schleiferiaceae bacterium]
MKLAVKRINKTNNMTADRIFILASSIAFISWSLLFIYPYSTRIRQILYGGVVTCFSLLYTGLFISYFDPESFQSFSTLSGLISLFSNKEAVLLGWIHYLAFDLLAGLYISKDAEKNKLGPWIIRPMFFFTFMTGPLGFLLYTIIRTVKVRKYHF